MREGILVVDVGTSKVHANVIGIASGVTLLNRTELFNWSHPHEGWSEADVNSEWDATQTAVKYIIEQCKGNIDVKALVLSTIGSGLLLMDKNGDPVGNMILAMDVRAAKEGKEIHKNIGHMKPGYSAFGIEGLGAMLPPSKVLWFKKNRTEDFNRVAVIGNIQHFFTWKLGFGPLSDHAIVSAGGFFDPASMQWDQALCNSIGVSESLMGPIPQPADTNLGTIRSFGRVDFGKEIPVILGTYDVAAGMVGLGCLPEKNDILGDVTGTFEQIGYLLDDFAIATKKSPPLMPGPIKGSYLVLGALVSGPNLDWFVNTFYPNEGLAAITRLFDLYPFDGLNKIFLSRDINSGDGTFRGLSLNSSIGDLFKGVVEGLTFPLISTIEELEDLKGSRFRKLRVGGGSAKSDKWSQLKAHIFDITVEKVKNIEITSVGSAIIAAVGTGIHADYATAVEHMIRIEKSFEPNYLLTERYRARYKEFLALQ